MKQYQIQNRSQKKSHSCVPPSTKAGHMRQTWQIDLLERVRWSVRLTGRIEIEQQGQGCHKQTSDGRLMGRFVYRTEGNTGDRQTGSWKATDRKTGDR
jgi:hypothetical protein